VVDGYIGLGVPIGTDAFIQHFVKDKCQAMMDDVDKLDNIQNGFIHYQLSAFARRPGCTPYSSVHRVSREGGNAVYTGKHCAGRLNCDSTVHYLQNHFRALRKMAETILCVTTQSEPTKFEPYKSLASNTHFLGWQITAIASRTRFAQCGPQNV
jgi:hypothetical protein